MVTSYIAPFEAKVKWCFISLVLKNIRKAISYLRAITLYDLQIC